MVENIQQNDPLGGPRDIKRPLTYGEAAVGLTFNPSNNPNVQQAKVAFAAIIDYLHDLRTYCNSGEAREMYTIAIRDAQQAQMWGVKAITWPSGLSQYHGYGPADPNVQTPTVPQQKRSG